MLQISLYNMNLIATTYCLLCPCSGVQVDFYGMSPEGAACRWGRWWRTFVPLPLNFFSPSTTSIPHTSNLLFFGAGLLVSILLPYTMFRFVQPIPFSPIFSWCVIMDLIMDMCGHLQLQNSMGSWLWNCSHWFGGTCLGHDLIIGLTIRIWI